MKPNESFIGQPIRSLQTMLRVISKNNTQYAQIIPDGIYGPETVSAVSVFQQLHGLPATGITDLPTWEAIVTVYEDSLIHQQDTHPIHAFLNPGQIIHAGEQHPHIYLIQSMLTVLSDQFESIDKPSLTGILDTETSCSLSSFQDLSGLPVTGSLDKHTWKHLVLHYPLAVSLQIKPIP